MFWFGLVVGAFIGSIGTGVLSGRITKWFAPDQPTFLTFK